MDHMKSIIKSLMESSYIPDVLSGLTISLIAGIFAFIFKDKIRRFILYGGKSILSTQSIPDIKIEFGCDDAHCIHLSQQA